MKKKPDVDRVFRALGDPTRRAMLEKISVAPISVSKLAEPFEMTLAAVVQHLQVLEESGFVRSEKVHRVRTYSIETAGFAVAEKWIADRRSVWQKRLDRLDKLLSLPE